MQTVFQKALELIMSGDRELCNILLVTAKMSLTSSLISLLIGVPVGLWLGTCKFPGNSILVIINRAFIYSQNHDTGADRIDHTARHQQRGSACLVHCAGSTGDHAGIGTSPISQA